MKVKVHNKTSFVYTIWAKDLYLNYEEKYLKNYIKFHYQGMLFSRAYRKLTYNQLEKKNCSLRLKNLSVLYFRPKL